MTRATDYVISPGRDMTYAVSFKQTKDLEYRLTGGRQGYSRTHPATENRIKQVKAKLPTVECYTFLDEYLSSL